MYYGLLSLAAKVPAAGYDSDAQAFFTAAGITDTTQKSAVNQLVLDLKSYSIWTKMKAIYPFVGGTASTHKWNLKDPQDTNAAFRLTFNGGITHSSSGVKGNSTNGYYETYLNPSTEFSLSTGASGFVSINEDLDTWHDFGAFQSGVNYRFQLAVRAGNTIYSSMMANALYTASVTNSVGFFGGTRIPNDNTNFYTIINSNNYASADAYYEPNSTINGFVLNTDNGTTRVLYGERRQSFACFGQGLTTTEAQNLRTAVNTFNTTLGR